MVNESTSQMGPSEAEIKAGGAACLTQAALLVIDVQERLAPAIPAAGAVVPRIAALIDKARAAGLRILATEQYSRGLGHTVPALDAALDRAEVIEKIHFAAPREPAFHDTMAAPSVRHALVAGMEAHVCVLQTVLALLERGVAVTVLGDAVASRDDLDRRVALARMARAGAGVTSSGRLLAAFAAAGDTASAADE